MSQRSIKSHVTCHMKGGGLNMCQRKQRLKGNQPIPSRTTIAEISSVVNNTLCIFNMEDMVLKSINGLCLESVMQSGKSGRGFQPT